jgi:hypothetical protein
MVNQLKTSVLGQAMLGLALLEVGMAAWSALHGADQMAITELVSAVALGILGSATLRWRTRR